MLRSPFTPLLAMFLLLIPTALLAQSSLSPEHERIDFLIGQWHTTSEFPDGRVGEGELEYRWVFDGGWMKVEFLGSHPDGAPWEAHVMQRWNPEEEAYEAWVFRDGAPPLRFQGSSSEAGRYRVEYSSEDGTTTGIDYRRAHDGAVYQENWTTVDGERRVTLRTTYRRVMR